MDAVVESFKPVFRMLGGVFALLVVLRIFLLWWNSPKQKGKRAAGWDRHPVTDPAPSPRRLPPSS